MSKENKQMMPPPGGPGGPGQFSNEKAKDFKKSMGQLIQYCSKYVSYIVIAIILAIAGTILNVLGPDKLSEITNLISEGLMGNIDVDAVIAVAWVLFVMYGAGFLFNVIQSMIMATISQRVSQTLRNAISKKINVLTLKYFDTTTTGDILSRVTNDVDTIGQTLNQSLSGLISAAVMFLGSLFMMFYTNWIMATSGILATIIGFVFMFLIISKSQKYFILQQEKLGNINGHIEEMFSGHNVVKAYNGEKEAKTIFKNMNNDLYMYAWKSQFMSGLMQPIMGFVGNFGYVVVLLEFFLYWNKKQILVQLLPLWFIFVCLHNLYHN